MYAEVAWALLEPSGTQVQPQIIADPGYVPDYISVSYHYVQTQQVPAIKECWRMF